MSQADKQIQEAANALEKIDEQIKGLNEAFADIGTKLSKVGATREMGEILKSTRTVFENAARELETAGDNLEKGGEASLQGVAGTIKRIAKTVKEGGTRLQTASTALSGIGHGRDLKWTLVPIVVITLIFAAISFSLMSVDVVTQSWGSAYFDQISSQLTFLGFIVALAAYLASVGRELRKSLKVKEDVEHRREFRLLTIGEMGLVLLGVLFVIRITCYPLGAKLPILGSFPLTYSDHALVACLGVTVLYLAGLHVYQWFKAT